MFIYKTHIIFLCFRKQIVFSQLLFHLLFRVRNLRISHFPVQVKIKSDSPPIQDDKSPKAHRFPPLRLLSDSNRPIAVPLLKLQVQIAGGLLLLPIVQKIIFHSPVIGAKRIQPAGRSVPVQYKRNKTLRCDRFSGTILSAEKQFPVCKRKHFIIVQPEIYKTDSVHMPTLSHLFFSFNSNSAG